MKNENQQKMLERFISGLEIAVDTKVSRLSFEEEWSRTGPEGLKHQTLATFLDKVCSPIFSNLTLLKTKSIFWPNYYDVYHSHDRFRREYQEKFDHKPYASPFMTKRW